MLTITQANIDKALEERGSERAALCCPIAQALKEAYPGEWVSAGGLYLIVGDIYHKTTKPMQAFMDDFDTHGKASPTRFRFVKKS